MRLWSIHPQYLDSKGLLATWREGLLAQHVLLGLTKGYQNHPQLQRFKEHSQPIHAIGYYLFLVLEESVRRGYHFNGSKLHNITPVTSIPVSGGQIAYEWQHFLEKMKKRDSKRYNQFHNVHKPQHHPLFTVEKGPIATWEKL